MLWLTITILAYFLFAVVNLTDKYLLGGRIPDPKVYTFYTGVLGILSLVLVPFGFLVIPGTFLLILALLAGAFHVLGVFVFFIGLKNFEASRIMPAMSALLPIFTFGLGFIFDKDKQVLTFAQVISFILLILGTILITWQKEKTITLKSAKMAIFSAFFFALYFVLAKLVYFEQPFISGFIWICVGSFLLALFFLFSKEVRKDIFGRPEVLKGKNWLIFFPNEIASASGLLLQNWAVSLAPIIYLGLINALEGVKYVFVLIFATFLSLKFPKIIKEEISKKILFQKIIAILLIGGGLVSLTI